MQKKTNNFHHNSHKEHTDKSLINDKKEPVNNHKNSDEKETFNKENQDINNEIVELKNKYLRSLAELENVKRFSAKQLEDANTYAISKFAKELLTVNDVFKKALAAVDKETITDNTFKSFIHGIELTKQELNKIFNKFHIKILDKSIIGEKFNPNFHEALMSKEDPNKDDDTIFEIFEDGYLIKDKLLRAAKVGVIKNT